MKITTRIALRYIFTLRSFQFITVITIISMIGIIVGVAALISVLSIFNGFAEFTESQMLEFDPHLRIKAEKGEWLENTDAYLEELNSIPHISAASAIIQRRVVAIKQNKMQVLNLQAVNVNRFEEVSGVADKIVIGSFDLSRKHGLPGIVIGGGISNTFRALPGDTISLLSPQIIEKSILSGRKRGGIDMVITGIFQTHQKDYDNLYCYASFQIAERLFKAPQNSANSIDIRLDDIDRTNETAKLLRKRFIDKAEILTWYDLHKELYNIMALERIAAFVVLSLIIVIAVFNILASLSMTVVEKKGDIALLKSLGATNKMVKELYIREGFIIGLISTIGGTALGLLLTYGQMEFGWFSLDSGKYLLDAIPVSLHALDVIVIFVFSLLLSTVATIYPAKRAARTDIAASLRNE